TLHFSPSPLASVILRRSSPPSFWAKSHPPQKISRRRLRAGIQENIDTYLGLKTKSMLSIGPSAYPASQQTVNVQFFSRPDRLRFVNLVEFPVKAPPGYSFQG